MDTTTTTTNFSGLFNLCISILPCGDHLGLHLCHDVVVVLDTFPHSRTHWQRRYTLMVEAVLKLLVGGTVRST